MNLTELAQHLEISPTTVSRVLSGNAAKYRISAKTVERVQAAAQKFQVSPDPLGSSLRSGKLGMIGLLVPDITNPFFSGLAREIEHALREHGMTVQLCDSAEDPASELALLRQMLGRRLDGMILAPVGVQTKELQTAVESTAMPVVAIDRILPQLNVPTVSLDNAGAGELAARHLFEAGHREIGCLRGAPDSHADVERFRGVSEALQRSGLTLNPAFVAGAGYTRDSGLEGAESILSSSERPTAMITLSGQGILALLEVAERLHIRIPEDVSVVAFDEQPWSPFVKPPLTTIEQPVQAMANRAVSLLIEALGASTPEDRVMLPAKIIPRQSVRRLTARG